jgi:hypothetical protein
VKIGKSPLIAVLCFVFLVPSNATPQTIKGYYKYNRNRTQVKKFLDMLRDKKNIASVPKCFFCEVYDDELPDLVVFIDKEQIITTKKTNISDTKKSSPINIALVKKGEVKEELFGERFIYVLVFIAENEFDKQSVLEPISKYVPLERKIKKIVKEKTSQTYTEIKESFKESYPISVSHAFLNRRPNSGEFALFSIAKGIAQAFTGLVTQSKEQEEKPEGKPVPLEMHEVGCHYFTRLTFGMAKIPLDENTINRITINGFPNTEPVATFGNYSKSYITSSVGVMTTLISSKTAKSEWTSPTQIDPFLLVHFYLKRPQLPSPRFPGDLPSVWDKRFSVSFVFGTKLSDKLLDFKDIFIGAGVGHLFGNNLGFVIGFNWRSLNLQEPSGNSGQDNGRIIRRKCWPAIGITYIF